MATIAYLAVKKYKCYNCAICFHSITYKKFCSPECKIKKKLNIIRTMSDPVLLKYYKNTSKIKKISLGYYTGNEKEDIKLAEDDFNFDSNSSDFLISR